MSKIGFIGAGNMGGALARAAALSAHTVYLSDKDEAKAKALASEIGATSVATSAIVAECDMIFLGVKPQLLSAVAEELKPLLAARSTSVCLVSFLAGVSLSRLGETFGDMAIIRMMPNTPVSVGEGTVVFCANNAVTDADKALYTEAMSHAGMLDELDEKLIDAATAVMGCGPAYVYLFIEALADGGVKCGLPRNKALAYAEQMILGSAKLARDSGKHPGELKDAVCSPGGSTIAGVATLEEGGFRGITIDAVEDAFRRTEELGK